MNKRFNNKSKLQIHSTQLYSTLQTAFSTNLPAYKYPSLILLHNPSNGIMPLPPPPTPSPPPCSGVLRLPPADRCLFSRSHCNPSSGGLVNYSSLHFCLLSSSSSLPLSLLLLLLLLFYLLSLAASRHFSPAVSLLASRLRLSPSMSAVTLLALGNGAPDLFAAIAAVRSGQDRTGLSAVVSAGAFVSAFVVGAVAVLAPANAFGVEPWGFGRDVFFYVVAVSGAFGVYLTGEIFVWQAAGMVGFYVLFVGIVFWMDYGDGRGVEGEEVVEKLPEWGSEKVVANKERGRTLFRVIGKVSLGLQLIC